MAVLPVIEVTVQLVNPKRWSNRPRKTVAENARGQRQVVRVKEATERLVSASKAWRRRDWLMYRSVEPGTGSVRFRGMAFDTRMHSCRSDITIRCRLSPTSPPLL